ncbi:MAG: hypothetical protein IPG50_05280 [Myxococcales bacterium]|nr:hypothetical protein [Myxococcales bacterium]
MRLGRSSRAVWLILAAACGSSDAPSNESPASPGGNGSGVAGPGAPAATAAPSSTVTDVVGLWAVSGSDARGSYSGDVEVRSSAAGLSFTRAIRYAGVTVEDGRELHWLIRGKVDGGPNATSYALAASLRRIDFIAKRGGVVRGSNDGPIALVGAMALTGKGELDVSLLGGGISIRETWRSRRALPSEPLYVDQRRWMASHDPPTASEKQLSFSLFANYHTLDIVKPYVGRADFQAAQHGHFVDPSDLDFYRQNPNALRVVDKVIDEVSLGETRARADSFRHTLARKAELYDKDIEERFVDPDLGMIPEGGTPGAGFAGHGPSGDGSLWTGIYLAGQVYRHQVTGSAVAKANVVRSLNALLTLQEITGDWSQFARTLRKPQVGIAPQAPWHAGTGSFSQYEWLAGGNNDMIKGLFYGYLMGWELLCEGGKTGHEALCARIRVNAKHLADDVQLGGSNAPASQLTNKLPAAWLAAVVAEDATDKLNYQTKASSYWALIKSVLPSTAVAGVNGRVEGSGAHLESVSDLVAMNLAKRMNLGGDATTLYRGHIDQSYKVIERQRFPEWDLLKAAFGSGAGPSSPSVKLAVSRLEEAMVPKVSYNIDRTLNPDFCMSPYPSHPWKGDWMQYPQADRTDALNSYPHFEMEVDILYWKVGNSYRSTEGYEAPGGDYLHLYWFGRKHNLIAAND